MAFTRELDYLRPEVRRNTASSVQYWPVVDGAHVTASSLAFTTYHPDGTTLQASTAGTITAVSGVGSSVSMSIPAIDEYLEGVRLDISFVVGSATYYDSLLVDVVRTPWRQTGCVTIQDIQEFRPDIVYALDRLGVLLGYTTGDSAQEGAAAVFAAKARVVLDGMLRASSTESGKIRAALILDRRALSYVEVLLALHLIYTACAERPVDGQDENSDLSRYYRKEAETAFSRLTLTYDTDDDGVADVSPRMGAVVTRRIQ